MTCLPRGAAALAAAICLLAWALPAAVLDGPARGVATATALGGGALLAAVACAWRAAVQPSPRRRAAWAVVAASSAAWVLAGAVWVLPHVGAGVPPAPPAADLLFLTSSGLAVVGLLALALRSSLVAGRLLVAMDGAVVATAALAVLWPALVAPFGGGPREDDPVEAVISVGYLVLDAAAMAVGALVLARAGRLGRRERWRGPLPLLAAAAVCLGVGDYLTGQAGLAGAYALGHPSEAPYALRSALLLLAALATRDDEDPPPAVPGRVLLVLPYVVSLVAVGAVLGRAARGDVEGPVLVVVGALALLLLARQVLTVLQHTALRRDLEARVAERTQQLSRQEEWFRTVLHHSSDAVAAVDADGVVVWRSGSPLASRLGDVIGRRLLEDGPAERVAPEVAAALADVVARGPGATRTVAWTLPAAAPAEQERHLETALTSLLHDPVVGAVVLTTHDVTERTLLQRQLAHQASHDGLTGLANRALLRERLEHRLAAQALGGGATVQAPGGVAAVLFCDLDGFKAVNDALGHAAGDALLREVALRLSSAVRPEDTVARVGGDEFAVLLDRVDGAPAAEEVARRVLRALDAPVALAGEEVLVSGSVGVAVAQPGTQTGEELLRAADLAMYAVKAGRAGGRGRSRARTRPEPPALALPGPRDGSRGTGSGEEAALAAGRADT